MVTPEQTIRVVAFDPGVTTGFASGIIYQSEGVMEVAADQAVLSVGDLFSLLEKDHPDAVVFETFEYRRNQKRDKLVLYSKELIGIMELYAQRNPNVHIHRQSAAQGKAYFTDNLLKGDNVFRPNMPHANDAMRHLLRWFTFGPGYKYNKNGYRPA